MARKNLFNIADADNGRTVYEPEAKQITRSQAAEGQDAETGEGARKFTSRPQAYRAGKRAVMFFLTDEAFSEMHVLLARQGRKKVQTLMEELVDDWFRRENAPRLVR